MEFSLGAIKIWLGYEVISTYLWRYFEKEIIQANAEIFY